MKIQMPKFPRLAGRGPAVKKRPAKLKLKAAVARAPSRRAVAHDDEDDYYDSPEPNMKLSHAFVVVLVLHVIAVAGVFAFNTIKARQSAGASILAAETVNRPVEPSDSGAAPIQASGTADTGSSRQISQEPASASATQAAGGRTHEVKSGETLTRISSLYGVSIEALQTENAIVDAATIRIGQILRVPAKTGATAADPAPARNVSSKPEAAQAVQQKQVPTSTQSAANQVKPATPSPAKETANTYVVAKGDNPVSIAKKLGVSYNELMTLNKIDDPRKLQIGQKLKVPAKPTN